VVVELSPGSISNDTPRVFELYLIRSGEWKYYHIPHRKHRLLCWVDLNRGVMLIDVFEEPPIVQYVRLPMDPHEGDRTNRNMCTSAGGSVLKFVKIFGRCCCSAAASCGCKRSHHAYTIHTWTMRIDGGDMEWVKDGMVNASEL
jgi:hypothetical protein